MGKQYGARIISKVLELQAAGYTQREIAKELGFEITQIKDLIKRVPEKTAEGRNHRDIFRTATETCAYINARKRLADQEARTRNSTLPVFSSNCWKDVRPEVKFTVIDKYKSRYTLKDMCEFFDVSRKRLLCVPAAKEKQDG